MATHHPTPAAASGIFDGFAGGPASQDAARRRITEACRLDEQAAVAALLPQARPDPEAADGARQLARRLAQGLRARPNAGGRAGLVQGLLQEYALSSQEGIALMCLAEALLRIPDNATRDALIRDKIAGGHWQEHAGRSPSLFVNAATWGLLLTGRLVATHSESQLSSVLARIVAKGGEPLIRKGVDTAMRVMGEQFVTGRTIHDALAHARAREAQGFRYSYDMLGEAAMTARDAERYLQSYEQAIHAIGQASAGRGVYEGPGVSVKLSALHPRYARAQYARVMEELYPALLRLALLARRYDIGLNIDAEEADRLELSLDLLEQLCHAPGLAGWDGIGFVVQAYQKRCPFVVDFLVDLARRSGHRLMVRLVKGAYWDSEIKRAQVEGQDGFPVFTRKLHTDVSYLACARRLLAAPAQVYPQFATHNAHTMAAIHAMAGPAAYAPGQYEFQCLHGMGEALYEQVVGDPAQGRLGRPCRIYAPVGPHETLLAYLVRRLLENGANTSFVHRVADPAVPIDALVEDPVAAVDRLTAQEGAAGLPHPAIAHPARLFGAARANSRGLDLSDEAALAALQAALAQSAAAPWRAEPLLAAAPPPAAPRWEPVRNPADHLDVVGLVRPAQEDEVQAALEQAAACAEGWAAVPPAARAAALERAADILQERLPLLLGLLAREAGKTMANGIAEVREAVDFLRFYAGQARRGLDNATHLALGPVACISPWNFPLSIFVGQVAAALAAGNPVLAKPAEQTPLVAAEAVRALHAGGVPPAALQLLPGAGAVVGARLVADARVQGVMFTGSTEVARLLQQTLSGRLDRHGQPVALIAETGGQNAMVVDSSALPEQVVADVMASAFDSAGQRCSALRVLCLQEEIADRVLEMLRGAMAECVLGNPAHLSTDVGPVIDAEARQNIERHLDRLRQAGRRVHRICRRGAALERGTYVVPALVELEAVSELRREVFGPVLHVVRYRRRGLGALLAQIRDTGYRLTLGLHTRIDETIAQVVEDAPAGNVYVNRNIVGAVVGVQPFGGEGLSGTGPKAGGPLYMYRLLARRPDDLLLHAMAAALPGAAPQDGPPPAPPPGRRAFLDWLARQDSPALHAACERMDLLLPPAMSHVLAGPTGERNVYALHPRQAVLCLAETDEARLRALSAALAVGCRVVWPAGAATQALLARLPSAVQARISLAPEGVADPAAFDVVLHQGGATDLLAASARLARRPGCLVTLRTMEGGVPLEALLVERSVSTNTAAAGGNASLMAIA